MRRYIKGFLTRCREVSARDAINHTISRARYQFDPQSTIDRRRKQLASRFDNLFHSTIQYGPLKGFRFPKDSWWSVDRATMCLGLYELEVLNVIVDLAASRGIFVDLGAAEGYYGVGVVASGHYGKSYCYEISEKGRQMILDGAKLNRVENSIVLRGLARSDFYRDIPSADLANSVILIDIEGGEFELLNSETLAALKHCHIIVEIHDFKFPEGEQMLSDLRKRASEFYQITEIVSGPRDPNKFLELKSLRDDDRWLICSEGRPTRMSWLLFDPIDQSSKSSLKSSL